MKEDNSQASPKSAGDFPATSQCPQCGLAVSTMQSACPVDGTPLEPIFKAGLLFDGKYEFVQLIGSGGMGVIYKARQINLDKAVAIKMLRTDVSNEKSLKRFQREGKAASALFHPNIIAVHDYAVSEHGQPYIVMDYVQGQTLEDKIQVEGLLDVDFTIAVAVQICVGLSHAHKNGVLHRDLKPANIIIIESDSAVPAIKILDFGIAKILDTNTTALTQTGDALGSPLYMSPEQCFGKEIDKRSELYAVGCTIYECLTGLPPFVGPSLANIVVKISTEEPPSLKDASLGKEFPIGLENIVMKLLRKNPNERYQSADELQWDLENFQEKTPVIQSTRVVAPPVKPRSNKVVVAVAAVICIIALGLVGLTIQQFSKHLPSAVGLVVPARLNALDGTAGNVTGAGILSPEIDIKTALKKWVNKNPNANTINLGYWELSDDDMPPLTSETVCLVLNLPGNSIKGYGLKYIEQMHSLSTLRIDKNDLDDSALSHLQNLSHLQALDLKQTHVRGPGLQFLSHCPLAFLNLSNTPITPDVISSLGLLRNLANLNVNGTAFSDRCVVYLNEMTNLSVLDLSHTQVSDIGVIQIAKSESLRELLLTGVAIDDNSMKALGHMKNLIVLDISGTAVTAAGIRQLANSKSLVSVYCAGCRGDLISAFAEIKKKLPNCQLIPTPRPGT